MGADDDNPRARSLCERLGYERGVEYTDVWSYVDDAGQTQLVREPGVYLVKRLTRRAVS